MRGTAFAAACLATGAGAYYFGGGDGLALALMAFVLGLMAGSFLEQRHLRAAEVSQEPWEKMP